MTRYLEKRPWFNLYTGGTEKNQGNYFGLASAQAEMRATDLPNTSIDNYDFAVLLP